MNAGRWHPINTLSIVICIICNWNSRSSCHCCTPTSISIYLPSNFSHFSSSSIRSLSLLYWSSTSLSMSSAVRHSISSVLKCFLFLCCCMTGVVLIDLQPSAWYEVHGWSHSRSSGEVRESNSVPCSVGSFTLAPKLFTTTGGSGTRQLWLPPFTSLHTGNSTSMCASKHVLLWA